jgi:hypothetical protein
MVLAVSAEAQTDPSMAAMFCLAFSAFTIASTVEIAGASGSRDPVPLWVVVVAESGEGKSRTFNPLIAPLRRLDRVLRGQPPEAEPPHVPVVSSGPTFWDTLLSDDDPYERVATAPPRRVTWATHDAALAAVTAAQAAIFPNDPIRFIQRSITPEALVERIATQNLGILQASPEGAIFSHMSAGRALEPLGNYNSMWSGEDIHVERIGRTAASAVRPILTVAVSPQPQAFAEIRGGRLGQLVERTGFLLRCLYCRPASNVGLQVPRSQAVPPDIQAAYDESLRAMLMVACATPGQRQVLQVEDYAAWDRFFLDVETRRGQGGDLEDHAAWATRVRQSTARIAGVLHVALHAGELRDETFRRPVSRETMDQAIEIGRWQLDHGRRVLSGETRTPLWSSTPAEARGPDILGLVRTVVAVTGEWVGVASDLLAALRRAAPNHPQLQTDDPRQLMRILRESDLPAAGMNLTPEQRTTGARRFRLTLLPPPSQG